MRFTPPRRASLRMAGFVIPNMLWRSIFLCRLVPVMLVFVSIAWLLFVGDMLVCCMLLLLFFMQATFTEQKVSSLFSFVVQFFA